MDPLDTMNINIKKPKGVEVHIRVVISKEDVPGPKRMPGQSSGEKLLMDYIRDNARPMERQPE